MSPATQYKAYLKATGTVAKTRQVVLLYDGAIRCIRQAGVAIMQGKIEERFNLLKKAGEIITGLHSSLDMEQGGDVARTLHNYYNFMFRRVNGVNFMKDFAEAALQCNLLADEMKQMREIWDKIDRKHLADGAVAAEPDSILPQSVPTMDAAGVAISA